MASKYWLKLYHEILDDPKMGRLPDRIWRRVIELFLIAGEYDQDGALPSTADMAWRLRLTEDEMLEDLRHIEKVGIVHCDSEQWIVTRFAERQAPVSDAERMRRYRERKHKAQYYGDDDETNSVTKGVTEDVTKRNVDTDTDIDTDKTTAEGQKTPPATFSDWQARFSGADNQPGFVGYMLQTLYPYYDNHKAPNYGFIGKLLKHHDRDYMLSLIFQHSARPPTGDPLRFVAGILSKGNGTGRGEPAKRQEYIQ